MNDQIFVISLQNQEQKKKKKKKKREKGKKEGGREKKLNLGTRKKVFLKNI